MEERTLDTMQVCTGGHLINPNYQDYREFNKAFCPTCGEPTITACPECKAPIQSCYRSGFPSLEIPVPSFCDSCGMAYPWQVSRVANAIELLRLEGVADADVQEIERNLPDIMRDTPRSQAAALRIRKILGKLGKPAYDVAIKVICDITAAMTKSQLGL